MTVTVGRRTEVTHVVFFRQVHNLNPHSRLTKGKLKTLGLSQALSLGRLKSFLSTDRACSPLSLLYYKPWQNKLMSAYKITYLGNAAGQPGLKLIRKV